MSRGLFSGKPGLTIGQSLYRVVNSLWSGASGFETNWDAPTPLVSIDFKNGVYSINEVSKILGEVCVQNLDWGSYNAADVVAGVGYRRQNGEAGNGPVLSAAAYAAIGNEFVAVMSYRFGIGAAAVSQLQVQLDIANVPSYANYANLIIGKPFFGQTLIEDETNVRLQLGTAGYSDGPHAAAARFSAGQVAVSFDGGAVNTATVTSQTNANTIALWAASTGSTDSSAIIEKVEFFALADYGSVDLPALSG